MAYTVGRHARFAAPWAIHRREVIPILNVSVGDAPAELRAATLAMRRADSAVRRDVASRMRETMTPSWRSEVSKGGTGMGGRILASGARIAGGNPPQLIAASSKRKIGSGGGLVPDRHWAGYEYGANRDMTRTLTSSRGKTYKRHVARHLPARGAGRVLEPAAARILPRVAALWTQSVVRAFMDAADGKG